MWSLSIVPISPFSGCLNANLGNDSGGERGALGIFTILFRAFLIVLRTPSLRRTPRVLEVFFFAIFASSNGTARSAAGEVPVQSSKNQRLHGKFKT